MTSLIAAAVLCCCGDVCPCEKCPGAKCEAKPDRIVSSVYGDLLERGPDGIYRPVTGQKPVVLSSPLGTPAFQPPAVLGGCANGRCGVPAYLPAPSFQFAPAFGVPAAGNCPGGRCPLPTR